MFLIINKAIAPIAVEILLFFFAKKIIDCSVKREIASKKKIPLSAEFLLLVFRV